MTIPLILFSQFIQQHLVLQSALVCRVRTVPLQVFSQRPQIGPVQLHPPFGYLRDRIMNYSLWHTLNPQLVFGGGRLLLPVKLHREQVDSLLSGGGELGKLDTMCFHVTFVVRHVWHHVALNWKAHRSSPSLDE